ncbi:glycosyltransferase [Bacteroides sp. BFG-257]|nr:glycosyltransferase [Bacteroides sp. BFG-257]UVO97889.1 glycosyltransferase [Bacteroides sp. BFG-257]
MGVPKSKVFTIKHYVDSSYYYQIKTSEPTLKPTVIVMGAMKRNFRLLADIVNNVEGVRFIICKGKLPLDGYFKRSDDIQLFGFVSEDELRNLMCKSDISLNIMDDTVGSNVITTSMAMGLAIIVSDVGSIRDYCDNSNAIFCKNDINSFKTAIEVLMQKKTLQSMKVASLLKSKQLSFEQFNDVVKKMMDC